MSRFRELPYIYGNRLGWGSPSLALEVEGFSKLEPTLCLGFLRHEEKLSILHAGPGHPLSSKGRINGPNLPTQMLSSNNVDTLHM